MMDWPAIERRRRIIDWRDRHVLAMEHALNEAAVQLRFEFDDDLKQAGWKDGLIGQQGFVATRLSARVRSKAEPIATRLLAEAGRELAVLLERPVDAGEVRAPAGEGAPQGYRGVALLGAQMVGTAAAASGVRAAAVTTTSTWLGLAGTTVVSWPMMVAGGAITATALAVSGRWTWRMLEGQLRDRATAYITSAVLADKGEPPSIRRQMLDALTAAAEHAREAA